MIIVFGHVPTPIVYASIANVGIDETLDNLSTEAVNLIDSWHIRAT